MNYRIPASTFLAVALFTASAAVAATIGPNVSTAIGPGFDLVTRSPGPAGVPSLPGVVVALDPASCGSNCGTPSLDLSNPANPVLKDPGPAGVNFSILWGMKDPGPPSAPAPPGFVFNLPATAPDANGDYAWSATEFDATGNQIATFQGVFHLVTSSPIDAATWVIKDPGPQGFQIDFSTTAAANATLDFTLSENGTPLSFDASSIGPNITTAIGPGFDLVTRNPGPQGLPSLPGVVVALDPASCGSNCGTPSLDLSNPANPVLKSPGPVGVNFSILWGMKNPGPIGFVFNLPATAPDANGDYAWSATEFDATGNQIATFQGVFHLVTSSPIDPATWVIKNPGPQGFQIDFSTTAAANATLDFTLSENNTPLSFAASIGPNITTAIGPGFDLVTRNPGPPGVPSLPEVVVALDPAACGANCGTSSLDLSNAANPMLVQAGPGTQQNFSILWGMRDPGPAGFVFNLPATAPDANGDYAWSATEMDATGNQIATYQGVFHLVTSSSIEPASWVIKSPGPGGNSFQINFSTMVAADPTLDFTLSENNTPLSFARSSAFAYSALVQQPINPDGSSIFSAKRGVVPVKFALAQNNVATCALPPATIALTGTAGGTLGAIDESTYLLAADSGSNFRISSCQYIYNLPTSSLGTGAYRVDIIISGAVAGSGFFALK